MNAYISVLIAISVLMAITSAVPALGSSYDEEACPDCPSDFYDSDKNVRLIHVPVRAWTDKKLYDHGSEIIVSGVVANIKEDVPVTVRVIGPQGNVVRVDQVEVSADKTFETSFSTAGALFKQGGVYTIRVQYGPQEVNDKITVELIGQVTTTVVCNPDEVAVRSQTDTYCIPFDSQGLTVTGGTVDSKLTSILLNIKSEDDGFITLTIPRSVLESQSGGQDTDFIVLVDGEEADFEETDSDRTSRTIQIEVPQGTSEIEIIGTWAIPEFGTMAAIILAVAIISIIVVSARSRLVLPKY